MFSMKKGNKFTFSVLVKDRTGTTVTNLGTSTEIYYMIKESDTDADNLALVSLTETDGDIVVDSPSTGYLSITIPAADTESIDLSSQNVFFHGVQIDYPSSDIQEINLSQGDTVKIIQDVVRG